MKYCHITSLDMLAFTLNVPVKQITGLLYGVKIENCYSSKEIPKKDGSKRVLNAPNKSLKYVQRKICKLLIARLDELTEKNGVKNNISHGFFKGKSIKTNALPHRNKKYVLNVDLEDFFDSIHFGRVQGFFKNNKYFKLPEVSTALAQLTCFNGKLPQGATTSPLISNLICQILDFKILKLCKKYKLTYTRYVDDLTFSTNNPHFFSLYSCFLDELNNLINNAGFKMNLQKTHFQPFNNRQVVTGLSVNKMLNVKKEFYKKTRSMANRLYRTGTFEINGKTETVEKIDQLHGRFTFINDLVKYNNRLHEINSLRLNGIEYKKFLLTTYEKEFEYKSATQKNELKWKDNLGHLSIREKDFQKFLFYKYFIANNSVTIFTEGKTDSRYIKAALKRLCHQYPELISFEDSEFKLNINFINRTATQKYFFGILEGGGGDLTQLLKYFTEGKNDVERNYLTYFKQIIPEAPKKPVIFLVDNERGKKNPLENVSSFLASRLGVKTQDIVNHLHKCFYYHIGLNVFVVTLPTNAPDDERDIEIEDLLNLDEINNQLIRERYSGKTFSPKKSHNDTNHIGKEIFSNFIKGNYSNHLIDFSGFKQLLDLINGLSQNYNSYTNN